MSEKSSRNVLGLHKSHGITARVESTGHKGSTRFLDLIGMLTKGQSKTKCTFDSLLGVLSYDTFVLVTDIVKKEANEVASLDKQSLMMLAVSDYIRSSMKIDIGKDSECPHNVS